MRARVLNFCRFESEGIVSLASTCRIFFNGLLSVVRQAKKLSRAIVEWPSCGAVVELTVDTKRERPENHFKDKRTLDQFVIGHASLRPARARAAVFASGGDGYIILGGARQRSR